MHVVYCAWFCRVYNMNSGRIHAITLPINYCDVIMGAAASQITSLTIVYSTVYSDADQRNYQSSASLPFVQGIHREPLKSPHKGPVTREMFSFDDVIMIFQEFASKDIQIAINDNGLVLAWHPFTRRWTVHQQISYMNSPGNNVVHYHIIVIIDYYHYYLKKILVPLVCQYVRQMVCDPHCS